MYYWSSPDPRGSGKSTTLHAALKQIIRWTMNPRYALLALLPISIFFATEFLVRTFVKVGLDDPLLAVSVDLSSAAETAARFQKIGLQLCRH